MCIGIPMQVLHLEQAGVALCQARDGAPRTQSVDLSLLEQSPPPASWLLVHIDVALRVLDPEEAKHVADALLAVSAAARGEPFEHLLGDLIGREPQLPAHLRNARNPSARPGRA